MFWTALTGPLAPEHHRSVVWTEMDRLTLSRIDDELNSEEVAELCFLCTDFIPRKRLEGVRTAFLVLLFHSSKPHQQTLPTFSINTLFHVYFLTAQTLFGFLFLFVFFHTDQFGKRSFHKASGCKFAGKRLPHSAVQNYPSRRPRE